MAEHDHPGGPTEAHPGPITVTVDEAAVTVPEHQVTVRVVLVDAGLDPATRQLVRVEGRSTHPYTDLDERLTLHGGEVFVTVSTGPTPVS